MYCIHCWWWYNICVHLYFVPITAVNSYYKMANLIWSASFYTINSQVQFFSYIHTYSVVINIPQTRMCFHIVTVLHLRRDISLKLCSHLWKIGPSWVMKFLRYSIFWFKFQHISNSLNMHFFPLPYYQVKQVCMLDEKRSFIYETELLDFKYQNALTSLSFKVSHDVN